MKCLADVGISMTTVQALRDDGHEVVHLREEQLERMADSAIMQKAGLEGSIVITFDLDFGDLLALGAQTLPSVILLRLQNQTPPSVTPRLLQVLSECRAGLLTGAIVTVEETRYRLRRLPIEPGQP